MEDFLRENYSFLTKSVEVMAAFTGLLLFKRYKHTNTIYFIYFLVYVAILELIGGYPSYFVDYAFLSDFKAAFKDTLFEKNYWWYNIFWNFGSIIFYTFFFKKILNTKFFIKIIKYSRVIFIFSSIAYVSTHWDEFFTTTISFIRIFGATIIILCVTLYFIEMLQSDTVLKFYKSINFYISSIILIWWLVFTPIIFFQIYFLEVDWNFIFLQWQIYLIMNIFMYTSFTIALIWCKPENN